MWARPLLCPDRAFDEVGSWVGWCWRRVWALFELGEETRDGVDDDFYRAQDPQDVFVYEFIIRNFMSSRHKR